MCQLLDRMNIIIPFWIIVLLASLLSFLIVYFSIPVIVLISKIKNLFDYPNERKMHNKATPVLGGLAIFAGIVLSLIIFCPENGYKSILFFFGGLVTVLIIGLKDDILEISPEKKLLGLILSASLLVLLGEFMITDFHGALGLNKVSNIFAIIFSILLIVFFAISFNFIDGIDGLAASFGLMSSLFYGTWFFITGNEVFSLISFATASSLIAFIRYNVFSIKQKIFLGDTGAMITGMIFAILTTEFIESQAKVAPDQRISQAPFVSIGLSFIIIADTIRVLAIRLISGRPFKASNNHVHHVLTASGFSQRFTSFVLISLNAVILLSFILLRKFGPGFLLVYSTILGSAFILAVQHLAKKNERCMDNNTSRNKDIK